MTDRISSALAPMQEYGRKPYLEKDYQNMMEATWHKAQDNSQIVVQSVKKKPYNNTDYQAMEQTGDLPIFTSPTFTMPNAPNNFYKFDSPVNTVSPNPVSPTVPSSGYKPINPRINPTGQKFTPAVQRDKITTQEIRNGLRWVQVPSSLSASTRYTVIVANSFYSKRTYTNGKLGNNWLDVYTPSELSITKASSDAKGLSIVGVTNKYSTSWFTIEASADVNGDFYLNATDGRNVIRKKLSMGAGMVLYADDKYYKISDLINGVTLGYNNFTQTKPFTKGPTPSVTYSESSDEGRPTETITYTYSYKWGGSEAFTSTDYRYNYYTPAPPPINWSLDGYVLDGYYGEIGFPPSYYYSLGIVKYYRLNNMNYGGADDYYEIKNTYIYHSFNSTYTDYPGTYKYDDNTNADTGYYYFYSYDFDANNYAVWGVDTDTLEILLKGKDNGSDFAISTNLAYPHYVTYGTVS